MENMQEVFYMSYLTALESVACLVNLTRVNGIDVDELVEMDIINDTYKLMEAYKVYTHMENCNNLEEENQTRGELQKYLTVALYEVYKNRNKKDYQYKAYANEVLRYAREGRYNH